MPDHDFASYPTLIREQLIEYTGICSIIIHLTIIYTLKHTVCIYYRHHISQPVKTDFLQQNMSACICMTMHIRRKNE